MQTSGPMLLLPPPGLWVSTRRSGCSFSWAELCLPEAFTSTWFVPCPTGEHSGSCTSYCSTASQASQVQDHMTESWHSPTVGHQELGASESLPNCRPGDTTLPIQVHSCMHAHTQHTYTERERDRLKTQPWVTHPPGSGMGPQPQGAWAPACSAAETSGPRSSPGSGAGVGSWAPRLAWAPGSLPSWGQHR